ncbi:MAG TPA: hypothetical protein QGF05_00625, partial [Dehalococcoidia bacterium]|nr:hypothetical protein [Dehalococcoidia bacterium]
DETFWRPDERRPDAAVEIALGPEGLPADEWVPATVAWDTNEGHAEIQLGEQQQRTPLDGERSGFCYLTFHGRQPGRQGAATRVRRLEANVLR